MVAWDRKSYLGLAEISSFVYLVQFKDGGRRVSLRSHLFVSDVDPGNEDFMWKSVSAKVFLHGPREGKVLLRSSASSLDVPWIWVVGVCGICGRRQKLFWPFNLKLGQVIRNLACGNQWMLLMVMQIASSAKFRSAMRVASHQLAFIGCLTICNTRLPCLPGRLTLDCRRWTLNSRRWTLDSRCLTLDAGPWILDAGYYTLDAGLSTMDTVVDCLRIESEPTLWFCLVKLLKVLWM